MNLGFKIIDLFRKTDTVQIYNKLIGNQWQSQDQLKEIQFNNLRKVLIHSANNVPYYQRIFNKCNFDPNKINDFSELDVLPILTKDDVRENFEDIKANNFDDFIPRITQTGGSTGKPFLTYKDKLSHSYLWANNFRGWNSTGYELGDKFIQIATGSLLPNTTSIKNILYNYFQNSELIPSYHLTDKKLRKMTNIINSSKAKFIYGYSSTLYLLSSFCKQNNIIIR